MPKTGLDKTYLFGQSNGTVTYLAMNREKPVYLWNVQPEIGQSNSGVSNLLGFDFTSNGSKELLISRDDGSLELYAYDIDNQLKLQFKD
jgi:hypothetical protein